MVAVGGEHAVSRSTGHSITWRSKVSFFVDVCAHLRMESLSSLGLSMIGQN